LSDRGVGFTFNERTSEYAEEDLQTLQRLSGDTLPFLTIGVPKGMGQWAVIWMPPATPRTSPFLPRNYRAAPQRPWSRCRKHLPKRQDGHEKGQPGVRTNQPAGPPAPANGQAPLTNSGEAAPVREGVERSAS
jgi:hypothetical protein